MNSLSQEYFLPSCITIPGISAREKAAPGPESGYALSRILITRTDSGGHFLNISEFAGNIASGAISTAYYPKEDRNVSGIFSRMTTQIGYDSLFNVFKEFYPDLSRKLLKKHRT